MANYTRVATGKAFKLEGVEQMKKEFTLLAKSLSPEAQLNARKQLKAILMKPAMVLRDEAMDLAPRRTGKLASSIIAYDPGDDQQGVRVRQDKKIAFYGRFVERGTSKMAAKPFFRPAIQAVRPLVARMIQEDLKKLIEQLASENAYHPPKH